MLRRESFENIVTTRKTSGKRDQGQRSVESWTFTSLGKEHDDDDELTVV